MNEINNLILQAVDTVVNARLQKQQKDTTIVAQIYENSDAVFGKYVIKYQNNYFDAESNNTEKIYRQNENVYVLLPKGDLNSPQKFILGAAKDKNAAEAPYVEITDPNQRYELVGPPITNLLWPESDSNKQVEYQIPGYKSYKRISTWPYSCLGKNQSRLLEYSKQYSYLQFSADFKYNPALDIEQCGNYGIEIGFFTNANSVEDVDNNNLPDEKNIITYRFDTESMYGNPFVQHNYLNRAITIQCNKGMIYDLAYITIFSEGFSRKLKENGEPVKDTELTEKDNSDIFIKNINIQFAELRTATDDYYANIVTPYGVYISESLKVANGNQKYIQLKPQMKYKGKLLNDVTFLWFEKNPQSDTTSENYHILGGRGWDLLTPNGENGDLIYSETDTNWFSKQIKLVAKYTDNIIREKEITIFKSSEHFVIGEAENPAPGKIQLYLIDADGKAFVLSDGYATHWERIEKTQQVIAENNDNQTSIEVDIADIKNNNNRTYRCYIYKNNVLIDIAEKLVSLSIEVKEDIYVVFECDDNNDGAFLYNENGYIEVEEFLKNRRLNFTVYKDGIRLGSDTANAYTYKWKLPGFDGEEIQDKDGYTPENSMITYLPCDLASSGPKDQTFLEYKIRSNFNRNYINNTITLEITYNGTVKYFPFTFTFSKQGDPGTNGTDYQMRIIATEPGKMLQYSTNKAAISNLYYKIEFYHNGTPEALDNYDIEIKLPPQCENTVAKEAGEYVGIFNNFNLSGKIDKQETYNFVVSGFFPSAVTKTVTSADNKTTTYSFEPPSGIKNYTKNILMITATPKNPEEKQFKLTGILPIGISEENDNHLFKCNQTIVFNGEGYSPSYYNKALNDCFKISNSNSHLEELDKFEESFPVSSTRRYDRFSIMEDSSLYMVKQNDDDNKFYLKVANQFNANEAINTLQIEDMFSFKIEREDGRLETHYHSVRSYFPLISTINQYSLMYINEWDGNSVEIKEDEGYIYAPQIGAGHKNTKDNTFTGVIMGEYVIDHEQQGVGIWGFQNGISSFGFREDGTAYIGQPGKARLEFDGNGGTISSAGFVDKSKGMKLDFTNGSIYAPSFVFKTKLTENNTTIDDTLFQFNLYNSKSKFLITSKYNGEDVDIFKATGIDVNSEHESKETYYLQSVNYTLDSETEATTGLKIDLVDGSLKSSNFRIDNKGNAFFGGKLEAAEGTFKGTLKGVDGTFTGKLRAATGSFSGSIEASSGTIGGWTIGDTFLAAGNITPVYEYEKDSNGDYVLNDDGEKIITNITYTGAGTRLNDDGSIYVTQGSVNLNGIKISADNTDDAGKIYFETEAGASEYASAKIQLKDVTISGTNNTAGAMLIQADKGIAIETGGTLYLRSTSGNKNASITMKDGVITLQPFASAVAVFG